MHIWRLDGKNEQKDKPFMTYEQQISKLKIDKRLEIEDDEYAIKLLKEYSYFDLISGYKKPFKTKDGNYKLHTSINDIYRFYIFDDMLRTLFLKYILKIEKHVKSLISYSFCEVNGEQQQHYLNATKYNYIPQNQDKINDLIGRLIKVTNDTKNYPYISHQKKKHGNIPLWVIMKALTLGTVSKMYSFLPQSIQHNVSKEFQYVHESMLARMLDILARVRNVCAHNERLYDYKYKKGTIDDTYIHESLNITKKKGRYRRGKNDLFAVVIVFKYLLDEESFFEFLNELKIIIYNVIHESKIVQKTQLYSYMGFPLNWEEIWTCPKGSV